MNQQEREDIASLLIAMAAYYGKDLQKSAIKYMVDDFEGYSYQEIEKAFMLYRKDPTNHYFPLPATIILIINPKLDKRTISVSLSNKIISKVKDKGRSWSQGFFGEYSTKENGLRYFEGSKDEKGKRKLFYSFREALSDDLGDIALEYIINHRGGWEGLCDDYYSAQRNDQAFFAQMREGIESVIDLSILGKLDDKPALPQREKINIEYQEKIDELLKLTKSM